jgi:transposase
MRAERSRRSRLRRARSASSQASRSPVQAIRAGAPYTASQWASRPIRRSACARSLSWGGSAGERAAAVMSLLHSAQLNGHEPYTYLKDVLTRLPTIKDYEIESLLPHLWVAQS